MDKLICPHNFEATYSCHLHLLRHNIFLWQSAIANTYEFISTSLFFPYRPQFAERQLQTSTNQNAFSFGSSSGAPAASGGEPSHRLRGWLSDAVLVCHVPLPLRPAVSGQAEGVSERLPRRMSEWSL